MIHKNNNVVRAEDPLLLFFLEGFPHNISHLSEIDIGLSWIHNPSGLCRMYITFLLRIAFNIYRIPGFGESRFPFYVPANVKSFFAKLTDENITSGISDLKRLYGHTQTVLSERGIQGIDRFMQDGKILLLRGIKGSYALQIAFLKERARKEGRDTIKIQTDTISSYCLRNGYTDGVILKRCIPIEDILLCNKTVALSSHKDDLHNSEDEWIVINRDSRGMLELKIQDEIITNGGYLSRRINDQINSRYRIYTDVFEEGVYIPAAREPEVKDSKIVKTAKDIDNFLARFSKTSKKQ